MTRGSATTLQFTQPRSSWWPERNSKVIQDKRTFTLELRFRGMHLINFVNDLPITVNALGDKYSIYVGNSSKLRRAFNGIGAFVFYFTPRGGAGRNPPSPVWNTQLVMTGETWTESLKQLSPDGAAQLDLPDPSPCTGLITPDMEGFIVASTIRLEMDDGRDVAIMLLSASKEPAKIEVEKATLSISSDKYDATVFITADDELRCAGAISGQGFKTAKLLLARLPNYSNAHRGFVEEIAKTKGPGQIKATWKPVSRNYEDTLVVFRPDEIKDYELEQIGHQIGADDNAFMGEGKPPFLIGDGTGTSYKLMLVLDRFLRRELSDETSITLR